MRNSDRIVEQEKYRACTLKLVYSLHEQKGNELSVALLFTHTHTVYTHVPHLADPQQTACCLKLHH